MIRFSISLKVEQPYLTGLEVPIQVLGALIVAALISKNNKRNKILRAVYFLPVICSANSDRNHVENDPAFKYRIYHRCAADYGIRADQFYEYAGTDNFVVSFISIWRSLVSRRSSM